MSPDNSRSIRQRGVLLATGGLLLALAVGSALQVVGEHPFVAGRWLLATAVTLAVQALVFALVHYGWDARLKWDRHFVLTPMLAATLLLVHYVYLSPELRELVLMVWLVTPLFVAGLAGFVEIAAVSLVMSAGYLTAVALRIDQGYPLVLGREVQIAVTLLIMGLFSGFLLDRLKRNREETKRLRIQLSELALTDPLTELPNRRHFEEQLRCELDRVERYRGSCALALVDVDHFKAYNDLLGYPSGDAALRQLAALMRSNLRVSDVVARTGGAEFAIIMVNTDRASASFVLARLRRMVAVHLFDREGETGFAKRTESPDASLTISAGVAICPDDGITYDQIVSLAAGALDRAKLGGRNRVCFTAVEESAAVRARA